MKNNHSEPLLAYKLPNPDAWIYYGPDRIMGKTPPKETSADDEDYAW